MRRAGRPTSRRCCTSNAEVTLTQSARAQADSSWLSENSMAIPGRPVCYARSLAEVTSTRSLRARADSSWLSGNSMAIPDRPACFTRSLPASVTSSTRSSSISEYAHADAVIVAYLTQARIQHLRHDESGALAMLREGQEFGEQRGWRRLTLSLAAEECRSLARAGHHEEARLVATRFDFHELPARSGAAPLNSDKALRAT